ncbi:MAG TPA: TonB-dependent receptor plug domain-containing protein, partial [Steroidobacteraceae bacterium]|nr:TonB-dependent receptor plug domain-containing protein [Steroidobacteraceae bacterium]
MSTKIRRVVATLISLAALPALAQQKPADNTELGEIIVTATRQATNLQDTPIAITAVTSETLEDMGLKSVADLSAVVPNAQFRRAQGAFGPGVTTFIRGLGTGDTSLGGEANVAYYIDDVYYPVLLGSNFDL